MSFFIEYNYKISNLSQIYSRNIDQVHDMMDDIADQQDVAREISDAISNPVAFGMELFKILLHYLSINTVN